MSAVKQFSAGLVAFWADYAALLLFGLGAAGVLSLIALGVWAKRSRKPLRPVALAVSMNLALLLNAEGMWEVLTQEAKLPTVFVGLVFAIFEICFLTATSLAAEQYRNTTAYGPDGKIVTPGHPGSMLYVAALIAVVSGVIVAMNAPSSTEKLLRLAVPCVIFLMWWAALTAAGQQLRRSRFAYSPRRLAERWGWLIPDADPDLVAMAAQRQVRRMVVNHQRVAGARWPKTWWRSRLLRDARTASEPVVAEVVEQLARIERVMALLAPAQINEESTKGAINGNRLGEVGPQGERGDHIGGGEGNGRRSEVDPQPAEEGGRAAGSGDPEAAGEGSARQVAEVNLTTLELPKRKPHPSARDRVIKAHQRTPDATHSEIAKRLNLSPATVKRHRSDAAQMNGHKKAESQEASR